MSEPYTLTKNNIRVPAPKWCAFSKVDVGAKIVLNGVEHAGVVSHRCSLKDGHEGYCECACSHQWRGFSN